MPRDDAGAEALSAAGVGRAVDVATLDACGSTNEVLLARAREAAPVRPQVLRALAQTAGRGRRGRGWTMVPGASLAFSIAWPLAQARPGDALSLAVGAALADALDPPADGRPPRIRLKWPNDLQLAGGRKLAGILVEAVPGTAVVGIGLNVRPVEAPGAAALAEIDSGAEPGRVFDALWPRLVEALGAFDAQGFAGGFAARWAARDALAGTGVRAAVAEGAVEGVAEGVDADGALRVRAGSAVRRVASGEVETLRPAASVAAAAEPERGPC